MTHTEHSKKSKSSVPCAAHHVTFGGHCLNCGFNAPKKSYDTVGNIIAFESGELDNARVIELFQHLIDSGTIHGLQGSYQRTAQQLIDSGEITR